MGEYKVITRVVSTQVHEVEADSCDEAVFRWQEGSGELVSEEVDEQTVLELHDDEGGVTRYNLPDPGPLIHDPVTGIIRGAEL